MTNLSESDRLGVYVEQAADMLGVSRAEFDRMKRTDPDFPKGFSYSKGGRIKYDPADLRAFRDRKKAQFREGAEGEEQTEPERRAEISEAVRRARAS